MGTILKKAAERDHTASFEEIVSYPPLQESPGTIFEKTSAHRLVAARDHPVGHAVAVDAEILVLGREVGVGTCSIDLVADRG